VVRFAPRPSGEGTVEAAGRRVTGARHREGWSPGHQGLAGASGVERIRREKMKKK